MSSFGLQMREAGDVIHDANSTVHVFLLDRNFQQVVSSGDVLSEVFSAITLHVLFDLRSGLSDVSEDSDPGNAPLFFTVSGDFGGEATGDDHPADTINPKINFCF